MAGDIMQRDHIILTRAFGRSLTLHDRVSSASHELVQVTPTVVADKWNQTPAQLNEQLR